MVIDQDVQRPYITVVLAMSVDGKIADVERSPARFSSERDRLHLETQIAQADGVLFGAGTLRAYGTTLRVSHPELLQQRQQSGQPPQPVQIVCSNSATLDPQYKFFTQPIPRWLLTTVAGAKKWQEKPSFEKILIVPSTSKSIDWMAALRQLATAGLKRLAVLGGGELVASLLALNLVDELWLTVCPLILGGTTAPTPVDGLGFLTKSSPRLELLSTQVVEQELFLHYRLRQSENLD